MVIYNNLNNINLFSDPSSIKNIDEFLNSIEKCIHPNLNLNNFHTDYIILENKETINKTPIIIENGTVQDAADIVSIFKDAYLSSYPYKEYENIIYINQSLQNPNCHWLIFRNNNNKVVGCFMAILDFKNKRGNIGRFAFKRKYQGKVDVLKASIGTMYIMYHSYRKRILTWFGEARTAHSKSQYVASLCGVKPLAFLPNKDLFFNKIESDLLQVGYFKGIFKSFRIKKIPRLIPECLNSFNYTNKNFLLGIYDTYSLKNPLKYTKSNALENSFELTAKKMLFNYRKIKFRIKNSNSKMSFYFNPRINIIEKVKYHIESFDEFAYFIHEIKKFIQEFSIRYFEIYVSAYIPEYQKILVEMGFFPRGYIPCWDYIKSEGMLEDRILFNYYAGALDQDLNLIPEGKALISMLNDNKM